MLAVSGPGLLLPLLALAAVLAVSGVAKARDRHTAADGFRALGLPGWTVRLPGPEALAALEICLAPPCSPARADCSRWRRCWPAGSARHTW